MSQIRVSAKAASRIGTLDPGGTVFAEFSALAKKHAAVNLGQGFPSFQVPNFIRNALIEASKDPGLVHQYTRSEGQMHLCQVLSSYYQPKLQRALDPNTEILTTVGASEAIYSIINAFVNPGEEVVIMQPFYDSYPAAVSFAGGKPVFVNLSPKPSDSEPTSADWKFDENEIRKAVKKGKTKILMINNPHNPVGKVFTRDELMKIAQVAIENDLIVIADEVYETLVYTDAPDSFIKFGKFSLIVASLPGMFERTLTVGSAGKMLGVTGWKIGWVSGPADLIRSVWMVHQFIPFAVATPLQEAVARAIEHAQQTSYFQDTTKLYQKHRDMLHEILQNAGMRPTLPHGGYFTLADTSKIVETNNDTDPRRDYRICRQLTRDPGVTAIPPSAFYNPKDKKSLAEIAGKLARFAFCKSEADLKEAQVRLVQK